MTIRKSIPILASLGLILSGCSSVMDPTNAEARGNKFSNAMNAQHNQAPKIPQNGSTPPPGN